jgi:hypothetical protein
MTLKQSKFDEPLIGIAKISQVVSKKKQVTSVDEKVASDLKITFSNLIDSKTGNPISVKVKNYKDLKALENFKEAGRKAAENFKSIFDNPNASVQSLCPYPCRNEVLVYHEPTGGMYCEGKCPSED